MLTTQSLRLAHLFCIILTNDSFSAPLKHLMQKAEHTELQISLVNLLASRNQLLTI